MPAVYGITRPAATWNPIKINFQHLYLLILDSWRTKNIGDKFRIWFMPTGWRPNDVDSIYSVQKIENVYDFKKYDPLSSNSLRAWSFIQLLFLMFFVAHLFGNIGTIGSPGIFQYGLFVFIYIYAMTELMDKNSIAYVWEALKCLLGLYLLNATGNWFGAGRYIPFVNYFVQGYLILSFLASIYFTTLQKRELAAV